MSNPSSSAASLAGGSPVGAFADIASGLIGTLTGALQRKAGKKWLANNPTPQEALPSEVTQNQTMAQDMAGRGLPSEQYNKAMKDIQTAQLVAMRSAQDRRAGVGAISGIQGTTNDATVNLNARDAAQRILNQRNYMAVNNQVAGWKHNLYGLNIRDPYNQERAYRMGEVGAGNQNLVGGFDKISTGALKLYGTGGSGNKLNYLNYGQGE